MSNRFIHLPLSHLSFIVQPIRLFIIAILCQALSPVQPCRGGELYLDITTACNRTYQSPWKNQEEFGYREWFKNPIIIFKETTFQIPDKGKVIVLEPRQAIQIDLPYPVEVEEVSFLCSSNFTYREPLIFMVELLESDTVINNFAQLKAPEWFPWVKPNLLRAENVVKQFRIYGDGRNTLGLIAYETLKLNGLAKSIKIMNNQALDQQHLLIAAITLHIKERSPVTRALEKRS